MAEKVTIGNCELYLADSREVLPSLVADALICDPPYGVGLGSRKNNNRDYAQPRLFEDAKVGAGETAVQGDMLLPANA